MRIHRGKDKFTAKWKGEEAEADRADKAVAEVTRKVSRKWGVRKVGKVEIFSGDINGQLWRTK